MNDSVMSVVAIFLAAVLMFVFPLMSTADRSDDIAQQAVQTATTEFVDNIRSTGKITQSAYDSFANVIAGTGNAYDIELEVQILDDNARKKTAQATASKVGENSYYTEYTSQIQEQMDKNDGVYVLKEGDIVSCTVRNSSETMSQMLKNFFYQVTGNNSYNISGQHAGIVTVNGN